VIKNLRPYQLKAISSVSSELEKGVKNQLLVMATGTGKTFTAVKTIEQFNFKRILWVTHQTELLSQSGLAFLANKVSPEFAAKVKEQGFIDWAMRPKGLFKDPNEISMGVIKADDFNIDAEIVLGSVQTLFRRLHLIPEDYFDCLVIDEAHLILSDQFIKPLRHFKPKLLLGLTATPIRANGTQLSDVYDKIVYEYDIASGIKDGYLCELDAVRVKTDLSLDSVKSSNGDFNISDLSDEVDIPKRNELIVDSYLQYANGRQGIFFCVDIEHSLNLAACFVARGIKCRAVSSDEKRTGDRDEAISLYEKEEITILTNVDVLSTGVDIPNTGCIGHAAPTKSISKWLQRTGRGTRLKDELYVSKFGQCCMLIDFCDTTTKHKLINSFTLDSGKATEEKVFIAKQKKLDLIAERDRRKVFVQKTSSKDVKVDLFELPQIKISNSVRMQEDATDAQLKWIASLGYDTINTTYTKFQCSEIISNQSASPKQIALLKYKGYDTSSGVTLAEFQAAMRDVEKKEQQALISKYTPSNDGKPFF